MLDDDTFWVSGGSGGVDDIGRVAGIDREVGRGLWRAGDRRPVGVEPDDGGALERAGRQPGEQCRLRHQHRGLCVGQHEGQPLRRVVRIERQVGAAGLEDAHEADDHLGRALDAEPDHSLGSDAKRAQMMRQTVGVGVEFGVAQRALLVHHGCGVRRALRLRRKQRRQCRRKRHAR